MNRLTGLLAAILAAMMFSHSTLASPYTEYVECYNAAVKVGKSSAHCEVPETGTSNKYSNSIAERKRNLSQWEAGKLGYEGELFCIEEVSCRANKEGVNTICNIMAKRLGGDSYFRFKANTNQVGVLTADDWEHTIRIQAYSSTPKVYEKDPGSRQNVSFAVLREKGCKN